ncbi:potassium channel family protein [Salinibacter grassmerensis]|uniref:potassium channel family protein n=1 Tax=Salinibacter grassmerensis TaxID=3040353 RepID=UPI0021E8D5FD|nr:TrkA family potassium uptake protein [Salinibacter grassmerensis]
MTAVPNSESENLHIIIAGAGRVGHRTARVLRDQGHDAYLIDKEPDTVENARQALQSTVIEGDATDPNVLAQADPERADVLAALTETGATNFAICAVVKHLTDDIRTVARIERPDQLDEEGKFFDRVVYPERAGAKSAVNQILAGDTRVFEDVTSDLDVLEIQVAPEAPVAGKKLGAAQLPDQSHVVFDVTNDELPEPGTELVPGHRYLIAAAPGVTRETRRQMVG